jgi:hypothetical protein
LRCSKEIPSCKRCQDISAVCTYPAPPDRKLLAAQRAQNAKARSLRDSGNPGELREYTAGKSSTVSHERSPLEHDPSRALKTSTSDTARSPREKSPFPTLPSTVLLQVLFPSKKLALALIDAYFDHVYNATLLFHRQTLASDYLAGKVPDCVALSIFALAAKYVVSFLTIYHQVLSNFLVFFPIRKAPTLSSVHRFLVPVDQARIGQEPRVSRYL